MSDTLAMEKKAQALEDFWHAFCEGECIQFLLEVIPLSRFAAETLDAVAICLASILILFGLICIAYSFYSRFCINLKYFSGPWIIRITFILFVIWWSLGEIVRLTLLRRTLHNLKWKETVCKCYIVSNIGFAEPCLILTLVFLLRAPMQKLDTGIMSKKWNARTFGYIILYCLPMFLLQVFVILAESHFWKKVPHYFTSIIIIDDPSLVAPVENDDIVVCTYPLRSIVILGFFTVILTSYILLIGIRILKLVINKGLKKRVSALLFSVLCFLPLRVLFLGLSILFKPGHFMFEAFVFLAFLAHVCCSGLCIYTLVYRPIADCLAMGNLQYLEAQTRRFNDDDDDDNTLTYRYKKMA
ncbi:uncharacterized protein LOC123904699 [Trifolium pratense]|uniref:uncharacterized protein LOC123904699 n=1 Tax=Trifolium pratense TaxID=57577 RepID=UPI001E690B0A|nr:uncharacterized protein LOC123904699 [Trifolium pratense]